MPDQANPAAVAKVDLRLLASLLVCWALAPFVASCGAAVVLMDFIGGFGPPSSGLERRLAEGLPISEDAAASLLMLVGYQAAYALVALPGLRLVKRSSGAPPRWVMLGCALYLGMVPFATAAFDLGAALLLLLLALPTLTIGYWVKR